MVRYVRNWRERNGERSDEHIIGMHDQIKHRFIKYMIMGQGNGSEDQRIKMLATQA